MKRFGPLLLILALGVVANAFAASAGCITNCTGFGTIYDVCPIGCTYTNVTVAAAAAASNGCICIDSPGVFTAVSLAITRTVGCITSSDTGTYQTALPLSVTANSVPVLNFGSASNITAVAKISHLHLLMKSIVANNVNTVFVSSGTAPNGSGYSFQDCLLDDQGVASTTSVFGINAAGFSNGSTIKFDRCEVTRSGIGSTPRLMQLGAIIPNQSSFFIAQNTIFDSTGITTASSSSQIGLTNTTKSSGPYNFNNCTFVGLSNQAHVFAGLTYFVIQNCAMYNPSSAAYEFDTATANASPVSVTANYNAFSNVTAYAGTGNVFGLASGDFQTALGSNWFPSTASILRRLGTALSYVYDVLFNTRPVEGPNYTGGAFEFFTMTFTQTPTVTPTFTTTPTYTVTPTFSRTSTPTPSFSNTTTPTPTFSSTATPSSSATNTSTTTPTSSQTSTPTPSPSACPTPTALPTAMPTSRSPYKKQRGMYPSFVSPEWWR